MTSFQNYCCCANKFLPQYTQATATHRRPAILSIWCNQPFRHLVPGILLPLYRKRDRRCWCNQQFTMFIWIRMWHPFWHTRSTLCHTSAWPAVNARFEVQNHLSIIILLLSVNVAWNLLTSPMLIFPSCDEPDSASKSVAEKEWNSEWKLSRGNLAEMSKTSRPYCVRFGCADFSCDFRANQMLIIMHLNEDRKLIYAYGLMHTYSVIQTTIHRLLKCASGWAAEWKTHTIFWTTSNSNGIMCHVNNTKA